MIPTFAAISLGYRNLWDAMTVDATKASTVSSIARRLYASKARYVTVSARTGVPWFVIAAIHERESSQDFKTQLGQGDPLNEVSTHEPKGMGPYLGPQAWENAAVDALRHDALDKVQSWSVERCCYELELYNGFGYRGKGINSPYLWSFTNNYTEGKYVADGEWNSTAVDKQCGTIPIIKALMQMDQATWPAPAPIVVAQQPKPTPVTKHVTSVGAGGAAGGAAASAGFPWWAVILIAVAVGVTAWLVIHYSQKSQT